MSPVALNLQRRLAVWDDGSVTVIHHLFNGEGEEPDEADEAVSFVTAAPCGYGFTGLVQNYPQLSIH